jgi:RNA ligase (TIGR02306 family)
MREATIQKILSVESIENADSLEKATVMGWQVVAKKGEFKPGDLCVFVEIDSVLPEKPEFEFMRPRKFRVKTVRLRGVLSQGIAFPLTILPEGTEITEGLDVSEIVGVTHYEKPVPGGQTGGKVRSNFPPYVSKTDEPRIQSNLDLLDEMKGLECVATVKINGTSATYILKDGDYHVCSRNNSFKLDDPDNEKNVYIQIGKKYDMKTKLESMGGNFAIQGEIAGPGIQKNPLGLKELELFVFNIYDIDLQKYMDSAQMNRMCFSLGLKPVPIDIFFKFDHTLEDLLDMAQGRYYGTQQNPREGIVIRPVTEMFSGVLRGRMSFKVLNNTYLEKEKE